MASFRKTAWCVRCNEPRPYRRAVFGKRKGWACLSCKEEVQLGQKYRHDPTRSKFTERTFQSRHEANREPALLALQNAGLISDLRYQVPFRLELYSTQAVEALLAEVEQLAAGPLGSGRRPVMVGPLMVAADVVRRSRQTVGKYVGDFVYVQGGNLVVEDPKGARPPVYRLKKALMVVAHNIEIIEPNNRGVEQRARGAGIRGRGTGSRFKGGR